MSSHPQGPEQHPILKRMKVDWDTRAETNAAFYIASTCGEGEEAFRTSGARDVAVFFRGLESLLGPSTTVVDIGCGLGRMDEFVAPRVRKLIGFDVSGLMVKKARARLGQIGNLEFHENDGCRLSAIEDGTVDLVFSHIVFQHVPREVMYAYFDEARRALRPGGALIFQVPEYIGDLRPTVPPYDNTWDLRFYNEGELRDVLTSKGFAWHDTLRVLIETPVLTFNQLRVHVSKVK